MRILFLAHRLPYPPNKGDKIRSFAELKAMCARHAVDLYCFYDDTADAACLSDLNQFCENHYVEKLSPVKSRMNALAALVSGRAFSVGYYHSAEMQRRVDAALESRHYDLIFAFSSPMAQYVEHTTVPKIMDLVDVDSDKWDQYSQRAFAPVAQLWRCEAKRLADYEKKIAEAFALTLVCTEPEAQVLRRKTGTRSASVQVLHNMIDLDYFNPDVVEVPAEIRQLQPYVLFTGSMDYFPNVDAAEYAYREVLPHLRKDVPAMKLVIAGRNPARRLLKLADDPAVHVTGAVPDIRPYLRGACAAVMPMRIARGVQNKVIEAVAMRLPVATTSMTAAALPESISQYLLVEDDPAQLATKLNAMLADLPQEKLQQARQALAHEYGSAIFHERLENMLTSAAGKSRDTAGQRTESESQLEARSMRVPG